MYAIVVYVCVLMYIQILLVTLPHMIFNVWRSVDKTSIRIYVYTAFTCLCIRTDVRKFRNNFAIHVNARGFGFGGGYHAHMQCVKTTKCMVIWSYINKNFLRRIFGNIPTNFWTNEYSSEINWNWHPSKVINEKKVSDRVALCVLSFWYLRSLENGLIYTIRENITYTCMQCLLLSEEFFFMRTRTISKTISKS